MASNRCLYRESEARRRVDDDQLCVAVAAVPVSVRLLGSITDRIAGLQQEVLVTDEKFDLPLENIGNFLAFMRDEAATAAARRDIMDAALEKVRLMVGDQPLECQSRAVAKRVGMHNGAFTVAGYQAIRLGWLRKLLPDSQAVV